MNEFYKNCRDTRYHVLTRNAVIYRKEFPKNSVFTEFDGVLYVCDHFPNYKGDARNILLKAWVYDTEDPGWAQTVISARSQNICELKLAKKMWIAHLENDHARTYRTNKPLTFSEAERMMQSAIRKKKSGGSGSRLIPGSEERDLNNPLDWREHSIYAHWAFSGDASMVAISARYEQNERRR